MGGGEKIKEEREKNFLPAKIQAVVALMICAKRRAAQQVNIFTYTSSAALNNR